jgi:hypothetical protein
MRKFSDSTKISIFRSLTMALAGSVITQSLGYSITMKALEAQSRRNLKLAQLNNRIVKRFAELAPLEVSDQVRREFEFDLIALNLELPPGGRTAR